MFVKKMRIILIISLSLMLAGCSSSAKKSMRHELTDESSEISVEESSNALLNYSEETQSMSSKGAEAESQSAETKDAGAESQIEETKDAGAESPTVETQNNEEESQEKTTELFENSEKIYEDFLNGKISNYDGKYISEYIYTEGSKEYRPYYYYIQSKNSEDKALVISYALGASVSNEILYAHDGILEAKAYFGRNAVGGTTFVDETYLVYGTTLMDCNTDEKCEFYTIQELDEEYNPKDVVLSLDRIKGCTVEHKYQEYIDGKYINLDFDENVKYKDPYEYLRKVCKANTKRDYYDAPDFAVEVVTK